VDHLNIIKLCVGADSVEDLIDWQVRNAPHWAPGRGSDGIARCALVLDAEVIRTEGAARRPFQGWRYLDPADSPRDLPKGRALDDKLPPSLAQALAEIGLR